MPLKVVWNEIVQNKKFTMLFIINLMVGLLGFSVLDGFKRSFEERLQNASRNLMTADLSISSRRPFTDEERNAVKTIAGTGSQVSQQISLYSMAASSSRTALVELKAIDNHHPFYGTITLSNDKQISRNSPRQINRDLEIWVAPEVLVQFNVKIGDTLKLGSQNFTITHTIEDDTGSSLAGIGYAPRIYIGIDHLPATQLIRHGSTARRSINIALEPNLDVDTIEQELFQKFNHNVRVSSYKSAGQDNGRMLRYLTDYLGLVTLVALFLSGIGTYYLFRSYINAKQREIAVLLTLGLPAISATLLYLIQLVALGILASLLCSAFSLFILPHVTGFLSTFSPISLEITYTWETFISTIVLGALTPVALCLPLLLEIGNIKPSQLFQEFENPKLSLSRKRLIGFVPALIAIFFLSVWQSHSYIVGSIFCGTILLASALIALLGLLWIRLLQKTKPTSVAWKMVCQYLNGQKASTLSCLLALSLSSLLINLIPQIESALLQEIKRPEGEKLPSLFVFDIQEDQEDLLKAVVAKHGQSIAALSPMIRARLSLHNGKPIDKGDNAAEFTREAERERRSRNRGVNLSYRAQLQSSEQIVAGKPFSGSYQGDFSEPGELSLEARYADRLGFTIGDELTFDIQGLPVVGKIVNLRSVKWNSFQPNFFLQFQPGFIDDAPKTFIAALSDMSFSQKLALQNKIVAQMPNISIIDVSKVVEKLKEIITQMSRILTIMAWLSVIAGLVVTFSIANHQIQLRLWDLNLMKILGASFTTVYKIVLLEFLLLSLFAGFLGVMASLITSWFITSFVFDGIWKVDFTTPLAALAWMVGLCLLVSFAASARVLNAKPRLYL